MFNSVQGQATRQYMSQDEAAANDVAARLPEVLPSADADADIEYRAQIHIST